MPPPLELVDRIAQGFHDRYEQYAKTIGYETKRDSAVPWADVPPQNKALMISVVYALLLDGVVKVGPAVSSPSAVTPDEPASSLVDPKGHPNPIQGTANNGR